MSGLVTRHLAAADPRTSPFQPGVPGFRPEWWEERITLLEGQSAVFLSFEDGADEVARALVHLNVRPPAGYGYEGAWSVVEIQRLEVVIHRQREYRSDERAIGMEAVAAILRLYPDDEMIALSLDDKSDSFWRGIGWDEYERVGDRMSRSLFASRLS